MRRTILKLIKSKRVRARSLPWVKKALTLVTVLVAVIALDPGLAFKTTQTELDLKIQEQAVVAEITSAEADERALKLAQYLESKDSVLSNYAVDFVQAADKYSLDWKLLAAIAGNESGFAKAYVRGTYNAWGWGGGYIYLGSWENAIEVISKALKENYADKWNAKTTDQIGRVYAEDPFWSRKVKMYQEQINKFSI